MLVSSYDVAGLVSWKVLSLNVKIDDITIRVLGSLNGVGL